MVFWCLFDTKKSTDSVSFFSTTFGELFLVYSLANTLVFWLLTPVSVGWGQKLAKFAVFLVAKILKMHIFFDLF